MTSSKTNDSEQDDYANYPENGINLRTRYNLALSWIPDNIENLLDAGCAWGYGTRLLQEKSKHIYGLDPSADAIDVAQKRYPQIAFVKSGLEKTPFESDFFDVVVCCETIEHVSNEITILNEIFRILKPGGVTIVTTPHKGLFGFMDPGNSIRWVEYFVKSKLSGLYRIAYKMRKGEYPKKIEFQKPIYDRQNTHRHYTLAEIVEMLEKSLFRGEYEIVRVLRSGLFIEPFMLNLEFYSMLMKFNRNYIHILSNILRKLSEIDYWIPYNKLAYNIAVQIRKKES